MKRWMILIAVALVVAALALTTSLWLSPFLTFVGANANVIQGLESLVQLVLWLVAGGLALFGFARGRQSPALPQPTTRIDIGRDDNSINIEADVVIATDRMLKELQRQRTPVDLKPATEAYVRFLIDRYRYFNFKGMGVFDKVPIRLPLLDLYVPLKARLDLPEGEASWKRGALRVAGRELNAEEQQALIGRLSEPQPVLELLKKHAGLIILGDPGAGKTTFLKFLALQLALGQGAAIGLGNRLPILAPLSGYANALIEQDVRLDDFIADYLHDVGVDLPLAEMLQAALKTGTALILLDGLDEVKDLALRHTVVERVADFCTFHRQAGNKFVITSRIVGYHAVRPTVEGLTECTLIDFDDDEIEAFVTRWTKALEQQAQGQTQTALIDAAHERQELLDAIRRNDSVRKLAANPLLLTILALMKRQGVTLPERRVELYDQYVKTLLSSWNRVRGLGRPPARDLDAVQAMRVLAPLALWMHEVNPGVGLVKREDLRRRLEAIYTERGEDHPEAATTQLIEDVREYAGLLLERGPGEYGFIHLTFEEYLAAVAVALKGQGDVAAIVDQLCGHISDAAWREVALLTIGYLGIIQQLDGKAGEVVEQLIAAQSGEAGEAVVLAGDAVLDAQPGGVPVASKRKVIDALIATMQRATVKPMLRRRAGLLLGRLDWTPADLDQFVEVPAGKFLYGDPAKPREMPYRYWIAKYPVTNSQFKHFIKADGYDNQQWWSAAGWSWRQGTYDSQADDYLKDWLKGRPVEKRNCPYFWDDHERANPIFPVVGVSWFEAEAYCNWLNAQLATIPLAAGPLARPKKYVVRLAREEEWERAARGTDGPEYPWGNGFDIVSANTEDSDPDKKYGIGTTAVSTYLLGASPTGAWDMSGNVWEWTASALEKSRVLRGGSWGYGPRFARCAARRWLVPDDFGHLGFRVVLSLA